MTEVPGGVARNTGGADEAAMLITVSRSGGVAGMTRRWRVAPQQGEATHWAVLVQRCPWGEANGSPPGADRFVWRIDVQLHDDNHEQVVADGDLTGPWRDLVDAVRAADSGRRGEGSSS